MPSIPQILGRISKRGMKTILVDRLKIVAVPVFRLPENKPEHNTWNR
jgi:hypothetical protein